MLKPLTLEYYSPWELSMGFAFLNWLGGQPEIEKFLGLQRFEMLYLGGLVIPGKAS